MVLLTSSAVSFILTTGVICTFTFLLFLSGYVLQQQTVRSLQEALRKPPERYGPVPTLPPQFAEQENETEGAVEEVLQQVVIGTNSIVELSFATEARQVEAAATGFPQLQLHDAADLSSSTTQATAEDTPIDANTAAPKSSSGDKQTPLTLTDSLAYIFTLDHPSALCSALLFVRQQRLSTQLLPRPSFIFLYPTTWESDPSPLHMSALTLMRDIQDEYSVIYHPVEINTVWSGLGIHAHLLGEVQRVWWDFDRVMYLKTPGMATDMIKLDNALQKSNAKNSWAPLSASAGTDPELLLYTRQRGLSMPRGEMRRLTASAMTKHSDHHVGEMDLEALAKRTAYVIFDEVELEHRRMEKEWYGGIFERFERGRQEVCHGRGLLRGEEDKWDLKRKV